MANSCGLSGNVLQGQEPKPGTFSSGATFMCALVLPFYPQSTTDWVWRASGNDALKVIREIQQKDRQTDWEETSAPLKAAW